jgi:hypothetical protein
MGDCFSAREGDVMHPFEDDVLVVRPNRLAALAAGAPVAIGCVLAGVGLAAGASAFVGLGLAVAWVGAATLLYAWDRELGRVEHTARARVDARGLHLDGALALPGSSVRAGWVQPDVQRGLPSVRLRTRPYGWLEIVVRDTTAARALLEALDGDGPPAPVRFWTCARPLCEPQRHGRAACLLGLFVLLGIVLGHAVPLALVLAVASLFALCAGVAFPTRLTVGADGVLMEWLGTERFVAWADVAAVQAFDGGVVLALSRERWITLRTPAASEHLDPAGEAMVERIQTAWRADRRAAGLHDEAAARLLQREGCRTREWVRAIRTLAGGDEPGYRRAAVLPERFWRVVEDPGADATSRIGAAVALSPSLDEAGKERMLAASETCVEPRVRIALATTATTEEGSSDEDLAAALDAIDSAVSH